MQLGGVRGWVGGGGPDQLNLKCQDLSKSAFLGSGGDDPDHLTNTLRVWRLMNY